MSLISVRNFIAPFSNKVGIGALVVVTIIVAVARISGAHSNRSESGEPVSRDNQEVTSSEEAAMNNEIANFLKNQEVGTDARARMEPSRNGQIAPIEDPVLSDLLRDQESRTAPQGRRPAQNNNGLSDIRRTLGLE
jgi:hypothetical protein